MNRIIAVSFLFLSVIFMANLHFSSQKNALEVIKEFETKLTNDHFDISFQIEEINNDLFSLVVTIDLPEESYVVSPFSKDNTYGHFNISITDIGNIVRDETLMENPPSVEEFDPVLNEHVNIVRRKTIYNQNIHILTKGDFEASGLVWFVLEPSCVPYDVEFMISRKSGQLEIRKTKTAISAGFGG